MQNRTEYRFTDCSSRGGTDFHKRFGANSRQTTRRKLKDRHQDH